MTAGEQPRLFRDARQQAEFDRTGAVALRVLSSEQARKLREIFGMLDPADGFKSSAALRKQVDGLHQTELDGSRRYKERVVEIACQWLEPAISELLVDYRVLTATLFVKSPGAGPLPIHVDPTMQDDSTRPTLFLWCALQDVDEINGALRLVEGSHELFLDRSGVTINAGYLSCSELLVERAVSKKLAAGEAILFDSSMFHGSHGNATDEFRFAVRLTCIPANQTGVMHRASPSDPELIETFRMDREDYLDLDAEGLLKGRFKSPKLAERRQPIVRISPPEMAAILDQSARIRAGETTIKAVTEELKAATPDEPKPIHLIHIGFPKCASTFLQEWFAAHPAVTYKPGTFGGIEGVEGLISEVLDEPSGKICRVTSAEALSDPRDPATYGTVAFESSDVRRERMRRVCTELAALFPAARILIVTRNLADVVISGYSEVIRQGGQIRESDYARIATEGFRDSRPFDYDFALAEYRRQFADRVLALPFELLIDDRSAFLAMIADFMGVSYFDIAPERVNPSLNDEQLYWYPRISRMLQRAPTNWLRRKLIGAHRRMIRTDAWRPLLRLLTAVTGKKKVQHRLSPEIFQKLPIECEELLKLEHYAPYRDIYRAGK